MNHSNHIPCLALTGCGIAYKTIKLHPQRHLQTSELNRIVKEGKLTTKTLKQKMKRNFKNKIKDAVHAFKHGLLVSGNSNYKVEVFTENFDENGKGKITDLLAISEERSDEIIGRCRLSMATRDRYSDTIAECTAHAKHQNELFYIVHVLTKMHEMNMNSGSNPFSFLQHLLGK